MALADALVLVCMAGACVCLFVVLRNARRKPETDDERVLRQYTQLTVVAAREFRKGHPEESLMYAEAARRLLDTWNERKL